MLPRCSPRFKLGVALYYFAFGCDFKTVADVGGIGESTAQAYVHEVSQAIISNLTDLRHCALYHHSFECNCKHKRRVRAPLGLVLWEGERDCEALRDRLMGALLRAREDRQGALGIVDKEYEGSDTRAALGQKKRQR